MCGPTGEDYGKDREVAPKQSEGTKGFFSSAVHDGQQAVAIAKAMAAQPATTEEPVEKYRHRVDPNREFLRK